VFADKRSFEPTSFSASPEGAALGAAVALLKLPAGLLTAVLGLLLMRGEFIAGLSALDSSEQIVAWAIWLGYAQQLLIRFVDQLANTALESVGGPANPQLSAPSPGECMQVTTRVSAASGTSTRRAPHAVGFSDAADPAGGPDRRWQTNAWPGRRGRPTRPVAQRRGESCGRRAPAGRRGERELVRVYWQGQHLAGKDPVRVADDLPVEVEDLVRAVGIAEALFCNPRQGIPRLDQVNVERAPGVRSHDPVVSEARVTLKLSDRVLGRWAEDAVDVDVLSPLPEGVL
jgi:hypothetical protein